MNSTEIAGSLLVRGLFLRIMPTPFSQTRVSDSLMLSRTLLCLAVFSASTPLLADTVWLKNGDKLSGKITLFDGGKLLIQTQYAGAVSIDWKEVKTLQSDQELLVKQDAYNGEKAKSLTAADD